MQIRNARRENFAISNARIERSAAAKTAKS